VRRLPQEPGPVPRPLPDGMQPAGVGDGGAVPVASGDAGDRCQRWIGDGGSGRAGGDRPTGDPRVARLRQTLQRYGRGLFLRRGDEVMNERESKVSERLHEAGETHHTVYRIVDGADDDWATWYSNWLTTLS